MKFSHLRFPSRWIVTPICLSFCLYNNTSDHCFHTLILLFERFTVFLSHQYREKRMEQEKELLQNQNTWLNSELKSKTDELYTLSRDKGKEILELKCSLQSKKEEVWGIFEMLIYQLSYILIRSLIGNSLTYCMS